MADIDTHLGPYAALSEQQKSLIAGTRLGIVIIASGHYDTREQALEELVRTHNEVQNLDDINKLFETHPDIFQPKITSADVTMTRPVMVTRPLQLRR